MYFGHKIDAEGTKINFSKSISAELYTEFDEIIEFSDFFAKWWVVIIFLVIVFGFGGDLLRIFDMLFIMLWATPANLIMFSLFPTTFMLRVSFSPAPECVIVVLLESSFSDPRAAQNCYCCCCCCYTLL